MPMSADFDRPWWERTFQERQQATEAAFGPSHPQGSPPGHVVSLGLAWPPGRPDLILPGACVQVFPPDAADPATTSAQSGWLYLTSGLSQPLSPGQAWRGVGPVRPDLGDRLSGFGAEFGLLMVYVTAEAVVGDGHRVPFGFHGDPACPSYFVGPAETFGVTPLDATAGIVLHPLVTGPASIVTSTGWLGLMIGTSVTADELAFARRTTTDHLVLLLTRAGVGQRSVFGRASVLADPRWAADVEAMSAAAVDQALRDVRRRAHSAAASGS